MIHWFFSWSIVFPWLCYEHTRTHIHSNGLSDSISCVSIFIDPNMSDPFMRMLLFTMWTESWLIIYIIRERRRRKLSSVDILCWMIGFETVQTNLHYSSNVIQLFVQLYLNQCHSFTGFCFNFDFSLDVWKEFVEWNRQKKLFSVSFTS